MVNAADRIRVASQQDSQAMEKKLLLQFKYIILHNLQTSYATRLGARARYNVHVD